jgi:hypothetical protein
MKILLSQPSTIIKTQKLGTCLPCPRASGVNLTCSMNLRWLNQFLKKWKIHDLDAYFWTSITC